MECKCVVYPCIHVEVHTWVCAFGERERLSARVCV